MQTILVTSSTLRAARAVTRLADAPTPQATPPSGGAHTAAPTILGHLPLPALHHALPHARPIPPYLINGVPPLQHYLLLGGIVGAAVCGLIAVLLKGTAHGNMIRQKHGNEALLVALLFGAAAAFASPLTTLAEGAYYLIRASLTPLIAFTVILFVLKVKVFRRSAFVRSAFMLSLLIIALLVVLEYLLGGPGAVGISAGAGR